MLQDVPALADQTNVTVDNLAAAAVAQAQEMGVDGPVTFPVSSPWEGFYIYKDSAATGSTPWAASPTR